MERLCRESSHLVVQRAQSVHREIKERSARCDGIEQITLPQCSLDRAQQLFLESGELRESECKARIVPQRAKIADVILSALNLQAQPSQQCGALRNHATAEGFERLTIGPGKRDGGVT